MKRNKRKGTKTMLLGLVLLAASAALTVYNLSEQRKADRASHAVLSQMDIPAIEEESRADASFALTDESGRELDWPLDAAGVPIPWPSENGNPLSEMTDEAGRIHRWNDIVTVQEDTSASEIGAWTTQTDGSLLPWIQDEQGNVIPWPTDSEGMALDWAEIRQRWKEIVLQLLPYQVLAQDAEQPLFVEHPNVEMPTQQIDGNDYIGVLEIPSLELSLPVMAQWSYPRFKKAPCRYVGSAYTGDLIIAAHNYDRHFGRIKTLELGDQVRFTDVDGNVFNYAVSGFETLAKKDVEQMEAGQWDLTLFTCTPGGAKRVTVRCIQRSYLWKKE